MFRVLCLLIGYACGLFNTSIVVGNILGVDIRRHGSGNTGTANTLRTIGFKWALVVLAGDMLKAVVPMLLIRYFMSAYYSECMVSALSYTGLGAVLGHNFPFYTGFKGGKGIATSFGMMLALDYRIALPGFALFIIVFLIRHHMSMGSMTAVSAAFAALMLEAFFTGHVGSLTLYPYERAEFYILMTLIIVLALIRHKANIGRLIRGEERETHLHADRNKVE